MELYATRPTIRGRILAALGFGSSDADAVMVLDQINEFIREACIDVAAVAWWARRQKESRSTLGVDQRFINLPSGSSIGDIIEIGIWDDSLKRYIPLDHKVITIDMHTDPLDDIGGVDDEATRDFPRYWHYNGTQIEIWPESDEERDCKIIYVGGPQALTDDATMSDVDCELIHRKAMSLYFSNKEKQTADSWERRYLERLRDINAWAHTCETVALDPLVRMTGDPGSPSSRSRFDYATAIANRS